MPEIKIFPDIFPLQLTCRNIISLMLNTKITAEISRKRINVLKREGSGDLELDSDPGSA
jgi:hypothetical protein